MLERLNTLRAVGVGVGLIVVGGTVGYMLIEGASFLDALYMTAITITTVGYREAIPLTLGGKVFTIVLAFTGVAAILVFASELASTLLGADIRRALGLRRDTRMIAELSDHIIVCGYGRMGRAAVDVIRRRKVEAVVVDSNPDKTAELEDEGLPVVTGDATVESTLRAAGIERARTFIASLRDDAHNVYAILLARQLNPEITIIARAAEDGAEERLRLAGAHRVINPYRIGGTRIAYTALKPTVMDFLEASLHGAGVDLELAEVRVPDGSSLVGKTVAEADVRRRHGVIIVALQHGEKAVFDPAGEQRISAGDTLVALGPVQALDLFQRAIE